MSSSAAWTPLFFWTWHWSSLIESSIFFFFQKPRFCIDDKTNQTARLWFDFGAFNKMIKRKWSTTARLRSLFIHRHWSNENWWKVNEQLRNSSAILGIELELVSFIQTCSTGIMNKYQPHYFYWIYNHLWTNHHWSSEVHWSYLDGFNNAIIGDQFLSKLMRLLCRLLRDSADIFKV